MAVREWDYLIVGLGIAGACLWHELAGRGRKVLVADAYDRDGASRVAPGVINPLAGKRLNPSWRVDEQLPKAVETYRSFESFLGQRLLEPLPIIRIIKDGTQREYFEKRKDDPDAERYIGQEFGPGRWPGLFADPYGSFESTSSGYLRVGELCAALRSRLLAEGALVDARVEDLEELPGGVGWGGHRFRCVIFCEGWRALATPWFVGLPFHAAKGEMLTLRSLQPLPNFPQAIVNRSKWILPLGNGVFRAGSTYSWDNLSGEPTEEKRNEILSSLREFVHVDFEVIDHHAGVRPIIKDFRPVMGRHPSRPNMAIFNGLGSKGVLSGPWLAAMLADHLETGRGLDRDVDVCRFLGGR